MSKLQNNIESELNLSKTLQGEQIIIENKTENANYISTYQKRLKR